VPDHSVDELRNQLRERGYLSHGIERWFALDPWSSRAFWLELATVALKAAALVALFAAIPFVAITLFRNRPLSALETLELALLYGGTALVVAFALVVAVALILKLRPELAVDTPSALLGISLAAAALLSAPLAVWWYRFDTPPSLPELVTGLGLAVIFFLVATTVISAAILSFSIYELQRIPAIHRKPRTVPMTIAAAILMALLFLPAYAQQERRAPEAPVQVVTTPTRRKVALVAVDGMTREIFASRPELSGAFAQTLPATAVPGESTAERWASVGTGTATRQHGVRAIEGVRFRGGSHLLQTLSRSDFVIHELAGMTGLARRQPLPPTVRRRDYVWELFADRGLPATAVNWWTTETVRSGGLDSVGQETIFAAATKKASPADAAIAVDDSATRTLLDRLDRDHPQFATVYLPALDVVLNRLGIDPGSRLAASLRVLDGIGDAVRQLRTRGYDVVLIGLPGDRQPGAGVLASTISLPSSPQQPSGYDVAPTLCDLLGFPPSAEMPGHSLSNHSPRIPTYGPRSTSQASPKVNEEYYENLRSLGYIR
jgi:hypothetical protein